jgi:hypothetical protein
MKQRLTRTLIGCLVFALLIPSVRAASISSVNVDTTDTVAGYSALIRVSQAAPEESIEIRVEKPDGSNVILEEKTDRYGKAKIDLEGFYTKRAGQYTVTTQTTTGIKTDTFKVYPDDVSSTRSTLELNKQSASANGNDYSQLKVSLKDQYSNPITGHTVQLLSSRLTDEIVRISPRGYTDEQGSMVYHLYSRESGISTFLAHDSTSNITLNDRARIAFYEPITKTNERGGHQVALASTTSGPVSYLSFEELPANTTVGKTLNFTLSAYDDGGNLATDYTGLIRFSATDGNASLPNDYQFEAEDQGSHTFSLSLSFQTTGTQTLTATDINNTDVFGETELTINNKGTGQNTMTTNPNSAAQGVSNGDFDIFTPAPGTYSSNALTFSGEARYGLSLEILDNGQLLGTADTTPDNQFTYEATGLSEGVHTFYIKLIDSDGAIQDNSGEIAVTIDTDAPELDHIEVSPDDGVPAGSLFTITAFSEPNLPQMAIIFNNGIFEMTEDLLVEGVYEVSLTAPQDLGEHSIDALLVDELGNEIVSNNVLRLNIIPTTTVNTDTSDLEEPLDNLNEPEEEIIEEDPVPLFPGKVMNVEAVAEDGKVTLNWEAPETTTEEAFEEIQTIDLDEETLNAFESELNGMSEEELEALFNDFENDFESAFGELEEVIEDDTILPLEKEIDETEIIIDHYRIYYGPDPDLMYSHIDTIDNRTTWEVRKLQNDNTYYFSVVAVTLEGLESEERSEPTNATPKSDEAEALFAAAQEEANRQAALAAQAAALKAAQANSITPETGPEIFWLLLLSLSFGYGYFKQKQKETTTTSIPFQDIR